METGVNGVNGVIVMLIRRLEQDGVTTLLLVGEGQLVLGVILK